MSASFLPLPRTAGGGEDFSGKRSDGEQAGQQGHQHHAHDGDARAGHELFHALAFGTGVVVAVTFQQVDDTPHAETGTEGDNEGLENGDCLIEKIVVHECSYDENGTRRQDIEIYYSFVGKIDLPEA